MKKLIFVVWSLLLTWEVTSCRDKVIVSSANPVQFWPVADSTYNETAVCSIEPVFWCQPWHCDDTIVTEIQGSASGYHLIVLDSYDEYLASTFFDEFANDVFRSELDLSSYCCQSIRLQIADSSQLVQMLAPSTWTNGANAFTTKNGNSFVKNGMAASTDYEAYMPAVLPIGVTPNSFTATIVVAGGVSPVVTLDFFYYTSFGGSFASIDSGFLNMGQGTFTHTFTFAESFNPATILLVRLTSNAPGTNVSITINPKEVLYLPDAAIVYKSDCLEVVEDSGIDCTELITYSNTNSFVDLDYSEESPAREFFLRIPAVFFDEEFPDEYESIDLSNSEIVQLSSEVKHKKLLDVGFVPYYMIQKLQLVLAHDNVIIQGMNWIKGDGMTKEPGNKRYPLKRVKFLLTDKDFIKRNVL